MLKGFVRVAVAGLELGGGLIKIRTLTTCKHVAFFVNTAVSLIFIVFFN